jgi:hypothetical protein
MFRGSLGHDGSFGLERRGVGPDSASDHRSTGSDRPRQPDVCGGRPLDCAYRVFLAQPPRGVWRSERCVPALQSMEQQRCLATYL